MPTYPRIAARARLHENDALRGFDGADARALLACLEQLLDALLELSLIHI